MCSHKITDELVIEALMKDANRFKNKWEHTPKEVVRQKPNVNFLNRTVSNIMKTNQNRSSGSTHQGSSSSNSTSKYRKPAKEYEESLRQKDSASKTIKKT